MSLLIIEGFDHYDETTWAGKAVFSNGTIKTSGGRYLSGGCWAPDTDTNAYASFALGGNHQEIIVGMAIYLEGTENGLSDTLLSFPSTGGTVQGQLHVGSSNVLYVTRGTSTILGTGSTPLAIETWYYIEIRYKVDDSAGEVEVKINGISEINLSSQDTRNDASYNSIASFRLLGGRYFQSGKGTRVDDLYALETASSPNDDFLGDCRVDTLAVNADGTTNQWTPSAGNNYENVDDDPPDGDTTYNETDTDGHVDLFDHVDLSQTTSVFGVQVAAYLEKTDAANIFVRLGTRSGGSNYWGSAQGAGASYQHLMQMFETDPATGSAWTRTGVNNAEFGIKRSGSATTTAAPTTAAPTTAAPTTLTTPPPTTAAPTTT